MLSLPLFIWGVVIVLVNEREHYKYTQGFLLASAANQK